MATNIDTGLTAAAALNQVGSAKIFTMSDGYEVVVYYNGTDWGYRIKAPGGSWGGRTSLTSSPTGECVSAQSGNNIMLAITPGIYVYKLAYSTGTHTITESNTTNGDGNVALLAAYVDGTNSRFVVLEGLPSFGIFLYSFAISNLAGFGHQMSANSPPSSFTNAHRVWALVGDGTDTCFAVWAEGTTVKVNRIISGTSSGSTSETAETGVPSLAASATGLTAVFDNNYVIIIANQNDAKLRRSRRSAQDTYDSWSDILTDTISGQPSATKKGTGSNADLAVLYRSTSGQANGEIYKVQRIGGTWESSGARVAGAASTGWNYPSANVSDLNSASAGDVPIVYVTGTSSTWTLVEDVITIVGSSVSKTGGPVGAGTMGGTKVVRYAKQNGIESGDTKLGGQGSVPGFVKSGQMFSAASLGGTKAKRVARSGKLLSSRYQTPGAVPLMEIVSRGLPATDNGTGNPGSAAVDTSEGTFWNQAFDPSSGSPAYLVLDLRTVPVAKKTNIWAYVKGISWPFYNTAALGSVSGSQFQQVPRNYTIEGHTSSGSEPASGDSGWTVLASVTDNRYSGKFHTLDLSTYNWFRIKVTDFNGNPSSGGARFNLELRDTTLTTDDSIFFYGDSITQEALYVRNVDGTFWPDGTFEDQLESQSGRQRPVIVNSGIYSLDAPTAEGQKTDFIGATPCKYVTLNFGGADANFANIDLNSLSPSGINSTYAQNFKAKMQSLIDYTASLGKIAIIPHITYCNTYTWSDPNRIIFNTIIDQLIADPANNGKVIAGPDLYTFFSAHTNLLRDGTHPTYDPSVSGGLYLGKPGYHYWHQLWIDYFKTLLYTPDRMFGASKSVIAGIAKTGGVFSALTLGGTQASRKTAVGGIFSAGLLGGTKLILGLPKSGGPVGAGTLGATRAVLSSRVGGVSTSASLGGTKAYTAAKTAGIAAAGTLGGSRTTGYGRTGGIESQNSLLGGSKATGNPKTGGIFSAGTLGGTRIQGITKTGGPVSAALTGYSNRHVAFQKTGGPRSAMSTGGVRLQFSLTGGISAFGTLGGTWRRGAVIDITKTKPGMLTSAKIAIPQGSLMGAKIHARN